MSEKTEALKQKACAQIDAEQERLMALGEDILHHPELGFKEERTSGKVVEAFQRLGLKDLTRPALTGVKAYLPTRSDKVRVAVIGELDAVLSPRHPLADPETGAAHACGHQAQITAMLGACLGLSAVAGSLDGQVCFIAAPAEEYIDLSYRRQLKEEGKISYLGGKAEMIAEGAFDDIDMAMMVHAESNAPDKQVVIGGGATGSIGKSVRFIGKEAHAGGAPWDGINALNAASLAIQAIHCQRETFRDTDSVRVHPIITKGGDSVNTVPADVRMESYVRAGNIEAMQSANAKVDRAIRGAAYAIGAKVTIENMPAFLPLHQDPDLSALFERNTLRLMPQALIVHGQPFCGSTDMGDLSYLMPVIHPTISGFAGAVHSQDFHIVNPYLAYIVPAKLMAMTVIDLLADGAGKAQEILSHSKRHTAAEYNALWQNLLGHGNEEITL